MLDWGQISPHTYSLHLACAWISGWKQTNVMSHPLRLPHLVLCDFFPFLKVKKLLMGRKFTAMCRLTTGIRAEKCVVGWFRHCANVIQCTHTNLDSIAYYTPSLYNTVNNCNTMVSIVILYYNVMGPPFCMQSVDQNVVMRRVTVIVLPWFKQNYRMHLPNIKHWILWKALNGAVVARLAVWSPKGTTLGGATLFRGQSLWWRYKFSSETVWWHHISLVR